MDYYPEVYQVIPTEDYKVYIYFDDGTIRLFDASVLFEDGGFEQLRDISVFLEKCTVLNNTLAWTIDGTYNERTCIDLDPFMLYETSEMVEEEPLHLIFKNKQGA